MSKFIELVEDDYMEEHYLVNIDDIAFINTKYSAIHLSANRVLTITRESMQKLIETLKDEGLML